MLRHIQMVRMEGEIMMLGMGDVVVGMGDGVVILWWHGFRRVKS